MNVRMLQEFEPPSGKVKEAIDGEFGSLDDFIAKFNPTTAAVQASDAPLITCHEPPGCRPGQQNS